MADEWLFSQFVVFTERHYQHTTIYCDSICIGLQHAVQVGCGDTDRQAGGERRVGLAAAWLTRDDCSHTVSTAAVTATATVEENRYSDHIECLRCHRANRRGGAPYRCREEENKKDRATVY